MNPLIQKLINEQNAKIPNSSMSGDNLSSQVKMWIPTGSFVFDTFISNGPVGGWPCGRIVELFGKEAIGKSTVTFQAIANVQKMGGVALYFDVEQAGAYEMMDACGVDRENMLYCNATSIEEVFTLLETSLHAIAADKSMKNKPVLAVFDSIAALTTDAEIEAGYENNMNLGGLKPKQLGKGLRKITELLMKTNCCLILINQTRQAIGQLYGDPDIAPGGKAKDFFASLRIKLLGQKKVEVNEGIEDEEWEAMLQEWEAAGGKKAGIPKPKRPSGEKIVVGCDVTAKFLKNKVGLPYRETNFRIMFLQGIKEEDSVREYAKEYGLINKKGGWYEWQDPDSDCPVQAGTKFQENEWNEYFNDEDVFNWLKLKIQGKIIKKLDKKVFTDPNTKISTSAIAKDE
jgi:recombination protein RecA